jgi:excisionase family DNA binding protein
LNNYYTAKEAIKKLGIPRSTFYDLVKANEIPKVTLPLRKQALYPKQKIDELAEERARILGELEQTPERLAFITPLREDLEQLVDIDRMIFHQTTLILPEEQQKRFAYNPEAMHVLKDMKINMVVGGLTMSPIKMDILERLVRLEIDETQVKPEDYLPYTANVPLDCYIIGIVVRPGIAATYYGSRLLQAALNYMIELLNRGVIIRRIYTVATTNDGERLARRLHFTHLRSNWMGEHEDFRHSYVLDLENAESKSRLVKKYLKYRMNLERRRKRYKKQSQT